MKIDREIAFAPRTRALGRDVAALNEPCIGCDDCQGICAALIEAMTLPDAVLRKGRAA